jgi:uncharacterized protein
MQSRSPEFKPERLEIQAFASAGATLEGSTPIAKLERLSASAHGAAEGEAPPPDGEVRWTARGEVRERLGAPAQVWLHVRAEADLPMTCQRCLKPVVEPLDVDRWFRFVASEEEAANEDTDAEEDLLVLQRQFKLLELIEDELLLALPVIARHDTCPDPLPQPAPGPDDEADAPAAPNPFAVLEALKKGPPRGRH